MTWRSLLGSGAEVDLSSAALAWGWFTAPSSDVGAGHGAAGALDRHRGRRAPERAQRHRADEEAHDAERGEACADGSPEGRDPIHEPSRGALHAVPASEPHGVGGGEPEVPRRWANGPDPLSAADRPDDGADRNHVRVEVSARLAPLDQLSRTGRIVGGVAVDRECRDELLVVERVAGRGGERGLAAPSVGQPRNRSIRSMQQAAEREAAAVDARLHGATDTLVISAISA